MIDARTFVCLLVGACGCFITRAISVFVERLNENKAQLNKTAAELSTKEEELSRQKSVLEQQTEEHNSVSESLEGAKAELGTKLADLAQCNHQIDSVKGRTLEMTQDHEKTVALIEKTIKDAADAEANLEKLGVEFQNCVAQYEEAVSRRDLVQQQNRAGLIQPLHPPFCSDFFFGGHACTSAATHRRMDACAFLFLYILVVDASRPAATSLAANPGTKRC